MEIPPGLAVTHMGVCARGESPPWQQFTVRANKPPGMGALDVRWLGGAACGVMLASDLLGRPSSLSQGVCAAVALLCCCVWAMAIEAESVILIPGIGLQLTVKQRGWWEQHRFLELSRIQGVVIVEAVTSVDVHMHLSFIVAGDENLAVAFQNLRPRLDILTWVYNQIQASLLAQQPRRIY
mmetsp:Transcript_45361/g.117527  ORF Transcript_45361/g.117527 Transcript_45361/m.117527 type:complete len:181 (+) Transcript_45361:125-667(+)